MQVIIISLMFFVSSLVLAGDDKIHWMKGCSNQTEKLMKTRYADDHPFKVAEDAQYGEGNFLKGENALKSAAKSCDGLKNGIIKLGGPRLWQTTYNTENEGCWYVVWQSLEGARADKVPGYNMGEKIRNQAYKDACGSTPSPAWEQHWHEVGIDFEVKALHGSLNTIKQQHETVQ